jgi:surface polysaccharide O-acyltransferase-like enzyme
MAVMVYMRTLFMTCVPLFMMLSGYLLCKKSISADYYKRIIPIYITYLLAGSCCIVYDTLVNHQSYGLSSLVLMLLSFADKMYFWYIEMYLGLFLLAPFLNVMYRGLEKQSHKKILVLSLIAMTALPSLLNSHQITHLSWWLNPTSSSSYHSLIPDWWIQIYPITYYIIGCYLREYPIALKQRTKVLLLLASVVAAGTYNLYRSYGVPFIWGEWSDHKSIFIVVISMLLFSVFQNVQPKKAAPILVKGLQKVSQWSLAAYLLSWIPDQYFYPLLEAIQPAASQQLPYFFLIVPCVLVSSLAMAAVVDWAAAWITRLAHWVLARLFKKEYSNSSKG